MPGPLPKPDRRRRNQPTIPTTKLPASGRAGSMPSAPKTLGPDGKAWWRWAWKTPQAAGWSTGDRAVIARRARLEDDLAVLEDLDFGPPPIDRDELEAWLEGITFAVQTLRRLAGGGLAVAKEMRELDDRLGLTPKGRLALRWEIVKDEEPAEGKEQRPATVRRLRAVDPDAASG